ncbi:unnamed protein product [Rotaria sp. Silwood2]|nr:unnamed protein product [Rotaria sp. Silwood2]
MSSDDDEHPPKELLQPLTHFQPPQSNFTSSYMTTQEYSTIKKPYQITFSSRDEEIKYTQKLLENCTTYNGDAEHLMSWLKETGAFIVKERYPETDHPFIIRHLLTDDALDYYLAHEDMIFNFYDLRKLLLHKQNALAPLRTLSSLDSISTLSLAATPPVLASTQLPASTTTTDKPTAMTTYTCAQSLEDLTQNDIRKTIIEDLQRSTAKFTGEHRQDVLKWLKTIEIKFDTADIPTAKKFDLIPQLLDKGALDWFQENKTKFNNSWSVFVEHFKRTFDSPNRARIAMQKLNSYTQSPYQDVRSFCSEMRKLFSEADPQMSSTMKLEFLLAKVNPSYRLDLLKMKPKDPTEFETMARDIENIYLVNEAIDQNTQFNTSFSSSTSALLSDAPHPVSSNYQQTLRNNDYTSTNRYTNSSRYNSSYSNKPNYSPRFSSRTSFRRDQTPSYQSSNDQQPGNYANSRNTTRQNLFNYQSSSATPRSQLQPPLSTSSIPPLMPSSSSVPSPFSQLSHPPASAATVICQWCYQSGHSARDCPF